MNAVKVFTTGSDVLSDKMVFYFPGYTIPKGWKVLVWFRSVHLDPEIYPNPREFDPSRWDVSSRYKVSILTSQWCSSIAHYILAFLPDIYVWFFFFFSLLTHRTSHRKQGRSFPLEQEAGCARETTSLRWKSLYSFTIFSSIISKLSLHFLFSYCRKF